MSESETPGSVALVERKRWLHQQIQQHKEEYQRISKHLYEIYLEAIEPCVKELTDIACHEAPDDIVLPDGRIMHYTGPRAHWDGVKWDMSEFDKEAGT